MLESFYLFHEPLTRFRFYQILIGAPWVGSEGRTCCVPKSKRNCTVQRDSVSATHQPDSKLCQRAGAYRVRSNVSHCSCPPFCSWKFPGHKTFLSCNDWIGATQYFSWSDLVHWIWQTRLSLSLTLYSVIQSSLLIIMLLSSSLWCFSWIWCPWFCGVQN